MNIKTYVLCLVLITNIFEIHSQEEKMLIGIQFAPSITSTRVNPSLGERESLHVISPGLTFDYNITENLTLNSGLIFDRKGSKFSIINDDFFEFEGSLVGETRMDYLTLPLMVTYSTKGRIKFYFGGGTFVGFLLKYNVTNGAYGDRPGESVDYWFTRKIDFGLSFITGLNITINDKLNFDIALRDFLGLIDYVDANSFESSHKTNSLSLVLGLKHRL